MSYKIQYVSMTSVYEFSYSGHTMNFSSMESVADTFVKENAIPPGSFVVSQDHMFISMVGKDNRLVWGNPYRHIIDPRDVLNILTALFRPDDIMKITSDFIEMLDSCGFFADELKDDMRLPFRDLMEILDDEYV